MDKYVVKRKLGLSSVLMSIIQKLMQRPDYYAIKHYQKTRRDKFNWLTH